ncbi:hypothetical protein PR003_g5307 [Phytophthora rubi]|uniref:Uncharacterized protein n=1 Tax=Phytophthora rubi TaxID=129364 RepID=A0A6A4FVQ7_9STRA|nr:hypothetical protein PR003_g5307 [Phytophthora rubi]
MSTPPTSPPSAHPSAEPALPTPPLVSAATPPAPTATPPPGPTTAAPTPGDASPARASTRITARMRTAAELAEARTQPPVLRPPLPHHTSPSILCARLGGTILADYYAAGAPMISAAPPTVALPVPAPPATKAAKAPRRLKAPQGPEDADGEQGGAGLEGFQEDAVVRWSGSLVVEADP